MSLTPVTVRVAQASAAIAWVNVVLWHLLYAYVYVPLPGSHAQKLDNGPSAHRFIVSVACLEVICLFGAIL